MAVSLLALVLAAGSGQAVASDEPPGADPTWRTLTAIDGHVRASMERRRTPGIALALTTRDGLAAVRTWGYADLKLGRPVKADTLFQIGSISKSFTALALLGLADEGRVDLDEPVRSYLPWWEVRSGFAPIRVVHLLTHTAGIPANRDDIFSSPYMARALSQQAAAWAPGSRFHYSNVGYQTLHVLLERVAGETYREIVGRRILAPLGMSDSRAQITLESRGKQAVGYVPPYDDRPRHRSRALVEAPHHVYRIGDGCIQSTAPDLAAYVRMWLNRGLGPRGRIVSAAAFERFATPHPGSMDAAGETGYGLGVGVSRRQGRLELRHGGGMVGFYAFALADMTDGLGAVVLANGPIEDAAIAAYALDAWRAALAGETLPDAPSPPHPPTGEALAAYADRFTAATGATVELRVAEDRLLLTRGGEAVTLEWIGGDAFYSPAPGLDRYAFTFGRDDRGEVVEVTHGPAWYVNERYTGPRSFESPDRWSAYVGRYRSFSPWFPYFEVVLRKDRLVVITGEGGETASDEIVLLPADGDGFRVGEEPTPEWLRFDEIVEGRAMRAVWSGHPFFRQ